MFGVRSSRWEPWVARLIDQVYAGSYAKGYLQSGASAVTSCSHSNWWDGIPGAAANATAIVQAVRILSSSDPAVAAMARHELKYIVRRSTQSEPTPELLSTYLSSTPDRRTAKLYYTYSSLWSRVRQACASNVPLFGQLLLSRQTLNILSEGHHLPPPSCATGDDLMAQGKVARCMSDDQYANPRGTALA